MNQVLMGVTAAFWSLCLLAGEKTTVASLAREGHWKESGWDFHSRMIGKPAPPLSLSGWLNGEVKSTEMKGKIVVVDFWATWCVPCLGGIPHNNELARKYASRGVLMIGACGSGKGEEKMEIFARLMKMSYPTGRVTPASTAAWNVMWWPTYGVVDRRGILRAIGLKPSYLERVIGALLEEQPA